MVVNLSAGVKAKLANAKLAQAGSTATVPVPTPTTPTPVATPVSPTPTAPTTPTPVTLTPTQPTPVAKTETVQPSVSLDYQDDSEKRLKEIQMNLEKAAKTNPDIFSNRDTYNQAFKYSDRSQAQKAIVDSAYNSFQQKNQVAQQQQAQLQAQQKLITDLQVMPVQDMVDKGLSQEQVTSLATNNPEKFAQYQKAKEDKIKLDTINGELSKNPMQEIIDKFKNATFEVPQLQEMFTEKMKVLEPQQLELNAKKGELTQIQDEMDNILNDARSELEGTGATDSYIRALASKRMQEITPLYNAKLREYNTILDDYQVKANNIEQEMGFAKDQFTMNQQAQTQQMNQLGFAMELMSFQTPQQKEDATWNSFLKQQSYMEGDINSTDPAIRKRAIQNAVDGVLKEFEGIPIQRSRDQIISDITNQVNSGKDLGTAITESLRKPIMDKPEYDLWKKKNLGISNAIQNINGVDMQMNSSGKRVPVSTGGGTGGGGTNPGAGTQTSTRDLISKWEGFRDKAYQDVGGVWTIGYGFTNVNGKPVKQGDTMDRSTADTMLDEKIGQYQNWSKYVTTNLSESQKAALTSFEYNLGSGIRQKSAKNILDMVNAGNFKGAGEAMKAYNKAGGKEVQGLNNRRAEEANLIQQTGGKTYTDSQRNLLSGIDIKNPTKLDISILQKAGLTLEDAYNFQAEKKDNRWSTGLDETEIKAVNKFADEFYSSPTAKTFNKVQEAYNFASKLNLADKATDNQALIYAFAKAMDPDSVVREGEYSTVQKYSQTWGDQFGMNINRALNNQEFISPEAKKNMVETIKSKYSASASQYELERGTIIKRINDYAGKDIGNNVVPTNNIINKQNVDYTKAYTGVFNGNNAGFQPSNNPYLNLINK